MKSGKGMSQKPGEQSKGGRECWIKILLHVYKARPCPRPIASFQCSHYTSNLTYLNYASKEGGSNQIPAYRRRSLKSDNSRNEQ